MSEEDEVGQEFDRVLRALMMGGGQIREQMARAQANRDQQAQEAARAALRERERETARIRDAVSRDSFWATANGERVANVATYGATLYNTDPNAAAVYDIVREKAHERFGLNVDRIRAAHPESENERHRALMHAVDDRLAAERDRLESEQALTRSTQLEHEADERREELREHDSETESAVAGDSLVSQFEDQAEQERDKNLAHEADADRGFSREADDRATAQTLPRQTQQQVAASYPRSAKAALAQSRKSRQPKARAAVSSKSTRPRSSGLSR